jgi:hypothetical protein
MKKEEDALFSGRREKMKGTEHPSQHRDRTVEWLMD